MVATQTNQTFFMRKDSPYPFLIGVAFFISEQEITSQCQTIVKVRAPFGHLVYLWQLGLQTYEPIV